MEPTNSFKLMNRLYDSPQPRMERKWSLEIKFTTMNKQHYLASIVDLAIATHEWKSNAIGWLHVAAKSLTCTNEDRTYLWLCRGRVSVPSRMRILSHTRMGRVWDNIIIF